LPGWRFLDPGAETYPVPLAEGAIRRKSAYASKKEALEHLQRKTLFSKVDKAALEAYVDHAFHQDSSDHYTLRCKPETEADFFLAAQRQKLFDYLHKIRVPVLVLIGEHSGSWPSRSYGISKRFCKGGISLCGQNHTSRNILLLSFEALIALLMHAYLLQCIKNLHATSYRDANAAIITQTPGPPEANAKCTYPGKD
jgi:hypothetical protein